MTEDRKEKDEFTDSELESFIRENREILVKLLRQEKDMAGRLYQKEAKKAEELKDKAEEKTIEFIAAVTDPEIHKHFMMAGFEFLMGVSAMVKAMPMPDAVRATLDLAKETRERTYEEARAKYEKDPSGSKAAMSRKIDITDKSEEEEPAPKKKAAPKRTASKKIPVKGSESESS